MTTEVEIKPARSTWSQSAVLALNEAYQNEGLAGAVKAFPDRLASDVASKLENLGILNLPAHEEANIASFVKVAQESSHPALFMRRAIAALRKTKKERRT
jgi:hypothetical protein